jgi:hypothetical protein
MLCASSFCVTGSSVPGTTGSPAFCARRRAAVLSPSRSSKSALGPIKVIPAAAHARGSAGIFRKKTVARMNGVDAALLGERHDAIDVQIGLNRALALADQIGFVRLEAMQAEAVFVRIDGDGANLQLIGGAENADGNFAAIQASSFLIGISRDVNSTAIS